MKVVTNYHPEYKAGSYSFRGFGRRVKYVDESASYEEDEAMLLLNKNGRYTMLLATGCSCWDGDWEGWADLTLAETRKLGRAWLKDNYGASSSLGKWITENLEVKDV
jgi:hypothetical protein